jgi:hypothetical protein
MSLLPGRTYVRKLRARVATGFDQTGSPLRLGHAVGAMDFNGGLPPEAVLCVRRFADPLPGRFKTDGAPPPLAWREAVTESLRTAANSAARPARESVDANANVVLFADQAELLACLARDWCCGAAPGQWWWRLLFPALDLRAAMVKAWTENPRHVPAALRRLEEANCVREFLAALPRSSVSRLLEQVLDEFGLDAFRRVLVSEQHASSATRDAASARARAQAPWLRWVKFDPLLPVEARQLLVIALMLERAPGVLRTPLFIREWRAWQDGTAEAAPEADPESPSMENGQPDATDADSVKPTNGETEIAAKVAGTVNSTSTKTERTLDIAGLQRVSVPLQLHGEDAPMTASQRSRQSAAPEVDAEFSFGTRSTDPPAVLPEPQRDVVQTEWAGVFYLLNVALAFGLYGDFTRPRHDGLALPVWDFLTLLGQRMTDKDSLADPLWPLFARLSGRKEGELPGSGFEPPTGWRVPGFEPVANWYWAHVAGRLRLRHPYGFFILDLPRSSDALVTQLEGELQRFGTNFDSALREDDKSAPSWIADPLEQWLAWLISCVQARLASALGVTDFSALTRLVFRHAANIEVTADCIAVRFRLAEHPIELRMAGLDRDPGWVPAAGRRIAFHYD